MKRVRSWSIAVSVAALCTTAVAAQQTEQLKFVSGGPVLYNGVRVGPYTVQVLSLPGQPIIDVFCVDYNHAITSGYVWWANIENLGTSSLGQTRLAGANPSWTTLQVRQTYLEAAWLAARFASTPPTEWGNIAFALWHITSGVPLAVNSPSWTWVSQAQQFWTGVNPNYWVVATDVAAYACAGGKCTYDPLGGTQEYVTQVTPEPRTVILLGTGLIAVLILGVVKQRVV